MTLDTRHIALSVACFIAGAIIGAGFKSCSGRNTPEQTEPIIIIDTVTIDTVRIKGKTKTIETHDTIWLIKPDSIGRTTDTIKPLVNETKEYRDTFSTDTSFIALGVRYSGYESRIDNIDLQYRFDVQPRTIVKKKGWGQSIIIGVGAGYGVSVVQQRVYAAPEVGVHITYGWGYHW